ncbi:hypothetical protein CFC21_049647 [Triticum aestivum]|uniref:TF-B3 domain-containing protein n=2 Tax=Triticum aestivum TaxID=4565 RepID=A0A9R1K3Q0_WHEAT|nr:hypothetical protein CFC21_049647 [Triticum aestivum]
MLSLLCFGTKSQTSSTECAQSARRLPNQASICIFRHEENLLDYTNPNNDTLMVRLANGRLLTECRIMLGTDKRATITTNWSEFCRRTNIHEGDICAFHFRITSKCRLVLTVHRL